ncbi:MAG: PEP-CTERM sorting domain-containing protein [Cyanobacteria bacterium J06592_8]
MSYFSNTVILITVKVKTELIAIAMKKVIQNVLTTTTVVLGLSLVPTSVKAATLGFADVVLDYFNSGTGTFTEPYGGEFPGGIGFPVPVSTDVVLGDDPNPTVDFLSLPTGSFVTVGFTDETVIDGVGDDIFIQEVGEEGERANVFVSSDLVNFTFLGEAVDDVTTAFDLATIGFTDPVQAVQIVGLDNLGGSPGFDVVNVQVLPGSIGPGPQPVPEPTSIVSLLALAALGAGSVLKKMS